MPRSTFIAARLFAPAAIAFITTAAFAQNSSSPYWLDVSVKARSILIDPADASQHDVLLTDDAPMGIVSPDGKRIAFIGSDPQRVKAGHDFDLFVADIDSNQPSGKANARRLSTDQTRPVSPLWLPDNSGIVFQAGDSESSQVWYVDLGPDSRPVRLSDGQHPCSSVSIAAASRVAWIVHKGSKGKQQFKDLMLHPSLMAGGHMQTLLTDQHISGYAISPDGKTLAWSGLGSMFLVNLETGESREIPLHGIHLQLLNHTVYEFAWRRDGKIIAIRCGFLGGISRDLNADPNAPWPRWFAGDKVFFVPVDWTPSTEALKVGQDEKFPSPTADDPKAEVSPSAGDQSKPWWVNGLPERLLSMTWINAGEAKDRIAKHPAPPGERPADPPPSMPPLPGQPAKKP